MKYFKTKISRTAQRYEITKENFEEQTRLKFPYNQAKSDKSTAQYALCPSCQNPIQLIGLSHKIKVKPHGKHTGKNIEGLNGWNQRKYEYCPFAINGAYKIPNPDELLDDIDEDVIELYELLKNQFDRVVYILQKELHIACSPSFWREVLTSYIVKHSFCYPWLTESNLPYILAYFGMQQKSCYSQKIEVDSELFQTLENHTSVEFADFTNKSGEINEKYKILKNKEGCFIKLVFRFYNHQQKASDGQALKESIIFCVDDNLTGKNLYEKKIEFSEKYFMNMVNKEENKDKRNQTLLDIAAECMPLLK